MLCDWGPGPDLRLGRDDARVEPDLLEDDEPPSTLLRDLDPGDARPGCTWTLAS